MMQNIFKYVYNVAAAAVVPSMGLSGNRPRTLKIIEVSTCITDYQCKALNANPLVFPDLSSEV